MNDRTTHFNALSQHPWYGKTYRKLSQKDINWCLGFINSNKNLSFQEFKAKVHFLGLDAIEKVKNELVELLGAANQGWYDANKEP